jgi:hypothetical protein
MRSMAVLQSAVLLTVVFLAGTISSDFADGQTVDRRHSPTPAVSAPPGHSSAHSGTLSTGQPPSTAVAPLTEAQCKGLGGKVIDSPEICRDSGSKCVTTDKDGVIHSVCLEAE